MIKSKLLQLTCVVPYLIWEFTRSNFNTFVVPNTVFGVLGAFVPMFSAAEPHQPPSTKEVFLRLPLILGFNWYNVLVFDLGNQRSTESIQEDILNKPWRPIPMGKVTPDQTRKALLVLIPISMYGNHLLGVWDQAALVPILSYMYNDLRGGDEIIRDLIISVAYAVANSASLKIAVGGHITPEAFTWIAMVSGVILTTMQVQDLKDKPGDCSRGRKTVALFFGDSFSRTSIAFFVGFWTFVCTRFWNLGLVAFFLPGLLGANVIHRVLLRRNTLDDSRTWKWWCLWTVALYSLPLFATMYGSHAT
ncbi:hypothetical protein K445DRAFT_70084 [Daldinia sp. EC12]|nr:hypothetical protein K445DRAFT_70084 [Daldinia sp. EC12]